MDTNEISDYVIWALLFEDEIRQTLMTFTKEWTCLAPLFPDGRIDQYLEMLCDIGDVNDEEDSSWIRLRDLCSSLFIEMLKTKNEENFYPILLEYLNNSNPQVRDLIDVNPSGVNEKPSLARWRRVIQVIREFGDDVDVRTSITFMINYSKSMQALLIPILTKLQSGDIDEATAKNKLLRVSVLFGPNAELHLLRTVFERGEQYQAKVQKFMDNFESRYEIATYAENRPNRHYCLADRSVREVLNEVMNNTVKDDPLASVKIPALESRSIVVDIAKEIPINLRKYQAELTEGAIEGQNTMICAPTNSGKTLTAVYICRKRWYASLTNKQKFKAILFVPTRVLVEQQYGCFKRYMSQLKIESICGDDNTSQPHRQKILNADIIVMTPMTLLNILNNQNEYELVTLDMFTLLIFDECHHTNENYPFNEIMNFYHDMKQTGSSTALPQIVGLTASIGAKDAKDTLQTRDFCAKICANLDILRINRVRRNVDELLEFSPVVPDELFLEANIDMGVYEVMNKEIDFVRSILLEDLKDLLEENEIRGLKRDERNANVHSQICALEAQIGLKQMTDQKRQRANDMIGWIKIVNQVNCISRVIDKQIMIDELRKQTGSMQFRTGFSKNRFQTLAPLLAQTPDFKSAPFQRLLSIIDAAFTKNPDSRVLIFVETRIQCQLLCERIAHYTNIESKYLTGSASTENAGLNKAKQNDVVARFRKGEVKILCCTSVADEGLDIPECNIVIKYNDTNNEVAHVQRKGRGRAEGARSILIAENEWIKKMEETNQQKVVLMREALLLIDNNQAEFQEKVEEHIMLNKRERERKRIEAAEARAAFAARKNDYVVACQGCNGFIVHSSKVFKNSSHYTAADRQIWTRVQTTEYLAADRIDSIEPTVGKISPVKLNCMQQKAQFEIRCQNTTLAGKCDRVLGSVIICRLNGKVFLPLLKCSSLVFVKVPLYYDAPVTPTTGERNQKRQWKMVEATLFQPRQMTSYEWADMAKVRPELAFSPALDVAMRLWNEEGSNTDLAIPNSR